MKRDYCRDVMLLCPVCGNSQFETLSEQSFKCSDCKTEFDKDELVLQNSASTDAHLEDMKKEIIDDIRKDFKKILKRFK